jgi:TPR repeat protein
MRFSTALSLPILLVALGVVVPHQSVAQTDTVDALSQCLGIAGLPTAQAVANAPAMDAFLGRLRTAEPFCTTAASEHPDNAEVQFHLAVIQERAGSHRAAVASYRAAAEGGIVAALTKLGDYYNFGVRPIRADADEAVSFYRRAAEQGDLAAQTTLGFMYRLGRGVPRDNAMMMQWMGQAADGGYHFAQYRLGQVYLTAEGIPSSETESLGVPNAVEGLRLLRAAAEQGNAPAALELAQAYSDGRFGIPENPSQQYMWTYRAVDAGMPEALNALGFLREQGRGVSKDPQRAAELYIEALETGRVSFNDLRGTVNGYTPRWDRGTAIAFQEILAERGLYTGAIDGEVGPITSAAARRVDN